MRESRAGQVGLAVMLCVLLAACGPPHPQAQIATATITATATTTATPTVSLATLPTDHVEGRDEGYTHIVPSQLAVMLEEKDFLLVNTHAPYGFQIEHTDAHIPIDDEGRWLSRYPDDRTAKIVLYCRSGQWSTVAAERLMAAGYVNVWHLDGGMVAWHAEDLPLVSN